MPTGNTAAEGPVQPEHGPREAVVPSQPERSRGNASFLALNEIEALRQEQYDKYFEALHNKGALTPQDIEAVRQDVFAQYDIQAAEYLSDHGINENHPRRDEYLALVRSFSIDHIPQSEWYAGARNPDGSLAQSGMEKLLEAQRSLEQDDEPGGQDASQDTSDADTVAGDGSDGAHADEDHSIDTDPQAEGSHTFTEAGGETPMHLNLDEKRTALARLAAKRQSKLFGRGGRKYDEAYDEYSAAVTEVGRHEEAQRNEADPARSLEQKNRDVIAFIFDEQRKLREQTVENLRGTKVGRFIEAMNKGGKAVRFLKGTALGVGVGLVASALIATGAGVLAGAATAGVMGSRFARGFAAADARNGRGMPTEVDEQGRNTLDGRVNDPDFAVDHAHDEAMESFEYDTKQEQKKRRSAAAWGMGGIVVGSVIGEGIHLAAHGFDAHVPDWLGGRPDVDSPNGGSGNGAPNGGVDGGTPGGTNPGGNPGGATPEYTFGPESQDIHLGEGWYETFQEMGIPADQRSELLQSVGPQLQQMGIAYPMGEHTWGISHPGSMPREALRVIADTARQRGIVTNSTYVFDA